MSGWTIFWIAIVAIFTTADITAASNQQKGDTFTEHIQAWWGSGKPPSWGIRLRRIALVAAWAILPVHLMGWI